MRVVQLYAHVHYCMCSGSAHHHIETTRLGSVCSPSNVCTHTSSIVVTMLSSSSPSGAASPALSLPPPPVVVLVLATPVAVRRILTVSAAVGWPEDGTTSSLPTGVGVVDDDPLRTGGWEDTTLVSPTALHNIHSCGLKKSLCSCVRYSLTQLNREL